ncbi:MAG: sensor histidine kinase [Chitinophagia bacterium]|nr:sensor histidine kinase [Chitinophagia bacterium]
MTIRKRSAWVIVSAVMIMLMIFCCIIYFLFTQNHRTHFRSLLKEKADNTIRLLEEVKEVDSTLLSIIDANTLHDWRSEKTIILNDSGKIIYSSTDDHFIHYTPATLLQIKKEGEVYFTEGNYETVGCFYTFENMHRYVLVAAVDEEQAMLFRDWMLLLASGIVIILLVTLFTAYFFAGKALQPLVSLQQQIANTGGAEFELAKVDSQLLSTGDEIASLAFSYNAMLDRLAYTFEQQKQFIRYASHELRTPLAVVMAEIDTALQKERSAAEYQQILENLQQENEQLAELVNRLLQISRTEYPSNATSFSWVSIYECLEDAITKVKKSYANAHVELQFLILPESDEDLSCMGDASLIQSALVNLLSNAVKYGEDGKVIVQLSFNSKAIVIEFINGGPVIPEAEREALFQPFFRSSVHTAKKGHGLGLLLVKNVAAYHHGTIQYSIKEGKNCWLLTISKI